MKARPLRVLMFGWEWPPLNSGGLGVACHGLTQGLARRGVDILFVLPSSIQASASFLRFFFCNDEAYRGSANERESAYSNRAPQTSWQTRTLLRSAVRDLVRREKFDVIHAHDWMSFRPALVARHLTGKPLVVHVHSTVFDRTGGHNPNQTIYVIEKEGMEQADHVVAVSQFTKDKIIAHYGIAPEKIRVLHNGLDSFSYQPLRLTDVKHLKGRGKLVLFVGRITLQKGPDYFVRVAKRILEHDAKVRFLMAGAGDMEAAVIQEASRYGITDRFFFAGFVRGQHLNMLYQLADAYVMPSVSEPFGITALEALANGVPAVLSKQSGVAEVVQHALKVDFWDIEEMANKILAVLYYPALRKCLGAHAQQEVKRHTWDTAAEKCHSIYEEILT